MPEQFPSFEVFYAAVNKGREPFPWQARLAATVASQGWPSEIGVPTGLGKTACIDIALWALAASADVPPADRHLPTRTWYVVNRRLLVDAAYDHGCVLASLLEQPDQILQDGPMAWEGASEEHVEALRAVASGLRRIRAVGGIDDVPVLVTRLRGAAELGVRPAHPAHPALIFSTVPMFASTWLFRGYASSTKMWPVDAAHAGIDALVLLDEAHLSRPLMRLTSPVEQCDVGDPAAVVPASRSRVSLVSLTATGDAEDPFTLDDDDLANSVIRQRLDAPKPVHLVERRGTRKNVPKWLAAELADRIAERGDPSAAVVFANTPATAREVFDELQRARAKRGSATREAEIVLLTGRMRQREAELARARILDPVDGAPAGRDPSPTRTRHLVVVATQTLEVGADLDFDVLVTESCGVRSLVQRLGRINRLGRTVEPVGVVVHNAAQTTWDVYGEEPKVVWERLQEQAGGSDVIDLRTGAVAELLGVPEDQPDRMPELLPAHLWEWAKTTSPPLGEAPPELFFSGIEKALPRVALCWRVGVFGHGDRLVPSVSIEETVEVPLRELLEVLEEREDLDVELVRLGSDRVTVEQCTPSTIRPGDVLVMRADQGLYDDHGWAPSCVDEVPDVSLPRWPALPLDMAMLRHWFGGSPCLDDMERLLKELFEGDDDLDLVEVGASLRSMIDRLEARAELARDWESMRPTILASIDFIGAVPVLERRQEHRARRSSQVLAADAFDDLSATVGSVQLDDHLASVGELAGVIARAVGLDDGLVAAVEAAGRFHDIGKADPRFQIWLGADPTEDRPVAKSGVPTWRWRDLQESSGWPTGGRHEELSRRALKRWLELSETPPPWDADLVMHLVLSHHGFGRPLVAPVTDATSTVCRIDVEGSPIEIDADLSITDWEQPSRFRRCCERYGCWGLALLEAIVRQADHLASSRAGDTSVEVA